jgi:hypothetical protein
MDVTDVIQRANAILPGVPVADGVDDRWSAIIAIGEYIESEPDAVWRFIKQWGRNASEDVRDAIATCLLEHLLEYHFADYFPLVSQEAKLVPLFADTFLRCWKFGQSLEPLNSASFDELKR